MTVLYVLVLALTTSWCLAGTVAVLRIRRRARRRELERNLRSGPRPAPVPVSVLKPLSGVDDALEDNLRAFFEQSYPAYEIIFGVEGLEDSCLEVVRRLRLAYPEVDCQIVVHEGRRGLNPKVRNLNAMLGAARYDLLVVSDSNVAVEPGYLREMCEAIDENGVGLVTNLVAGGAEGNLWATVEGLQLNGPTATGVAVATELLDHPVVIGKSMMFRRSVFERLGGFSSVADVLAEDYVIGRMFREAGYRVHVCETPVRDVRVQASARAAFDRQVRWGMLRLRLQPLAYLAEPLSVPLFVALLAPAFGVSLAAACTWALVVTVVREAGQWWSLRGPSGLVKALPLIPLREALVLAAWGRALFRKHIAWRGTRLRVSAGTRLFAERSSVRSGEVRIEGRLPVPVPAAERLWVRGGSLGRW